MILVVGGSGYIGSKLCAYFSAKGITALGTYCRNPRPGLVHLNLEKPDLGSLRADPDGISHAIICSAISKIDQCKKEEQMARAVNVEGTCRLIEQLFEKGIIPVFLSSDNVFDGSLGDYKEIDERKPVNTYGMHKKAVEDFLMARKEKSLILRLSKIYGVERGDGTILTSWEEQLSGGREIRCAHDNIFNPTWIEDLVRAIDLAINNNITGSYNCCSPEKFSRYDMALMLKKVFGINSGRIASCSYRDFNFLEPRALNTSMNPARFITATKMKFSTLKENIERLKAVLSAS